MKDILRLIMMREKGVEEMKSCEKEGRKSNKKYLYCAIINIYSTKGVTYLSFLFLESHTHIINNYT